MARFCTLTCRSKHKVYKSNKQKSTVLSMSRPWELWCDAQHTNKFSSAMVVQNVRYTHSLKKLRRWLSSWNPSVFGEEILLPRHRFFAIPNGIIHSLDYLHSLYSVERIQRRLDYLTIFYRYLFTKRPSDMYSKIAMLDFTFLIVCSQESGINTRLHTVHSTATTDNHNQSCCIYSMVIYSYLS
jgi:hypothetical protein